MRKMMKTAYEVMMLLLVIMTITTIWREQTYNSMVNWVVWAVFFVDFVIRFTVAREKWNFIKRNPFLVIAIIPFDQFFQIARIVRLIYFFRIKTIVKYYVSPFVRKLTYQSITLIIFIVIGIMITEVLIILKTEAAVTGFVHAVKIVFSHLLFFGHRIYIVNDTLSIWILTITSIIGVVMQGLALQWGFTKLEEIYHHLKKQWESTKAS